MDTQKQLRVHSGSVQGWKRAMPDDEDVTFFVSAEREVKNILIAAAEKKVSVVVWIPREYIENLETRYPLWFLNNAENIIRSKRIKGYDLNMLLIIDGYNQELRELWQIEEVRQWVSRFVNFAKRRIRFFDDATKSWLSLCCGRDLRGKDAVGAAGAAGRSKALSTAVCRCVPL